MFGPAHGPTLLRLAEQIGAEPVWATNWDHDANTTIGPASGLPVLSVIKVRAWLEPRAGQPFRWKFGAVARYAAGRPVAWLDDDFDVHPDARDEFLAKRDANGLATELVRGDRTSGSPMTIWPRSHAGDIRCRAMPPAAGERHGRCGDDARPSPRATRAVPPGPDNAPLGFWQATARGEATLGSHGNKPSRGR